MQKITFVQEFRAIATQLNTYRIAGDWADLADDLEGEGITLTSSEAAAWAGIGYLPTSAKPLILMGVTPGDEKSYATSRGESRDEWPKIGPDAAKQ